VLYFDGTGLWGAAHRGGTAARSAHLCGCALSIEPLAERVARVDGPMFAAGCTALTKEDLCSSLFPRSPQLTPSRARFTRRPSARSPCIFEKP
jgi:hypothetical protein